MPALPTPAIVQRVLRAARHEFVARSYRHPILPNTVFYEAFAGSGMLCNPEAIYHQLRADPAYTHLRHVWAIADKDELRRLRHKYRYDPLVSFVHRLSPAYYRFLATSQYLINNATFPPEFSKRDGQVYVNTWHGTPLKLMGYDMPNGAWESANTLRNFMSADFLLSQNPFTTEVMYEKAYRLSGLYPGTVLELGYPRLDRQRAASTSDGTETAASAAASRPDGSTAPGSVTANPDRSTNVLAAASHAEGRAALAAAGIALNGRRVVLYAPTWKGERFADVRDDIATLSRDVTELQRLLGDDHLVLLKTHQSVYHFATSTEGVQNRQFRAVLVPNSIPTNVVLGVTEVLVTDFSSIFFDFLATGRPVAFYVPDPADYERSRGTYIDLDELPGPVAHTVADLADSLIGFAGRHNPVEARRQQWQERFTPYDDGRVTERVIEAIFGVGEVHGPGRAVRLGEDVNVGRQSGSEGDRTVTGGARFDEMAGAARQGQSILAAQAASATQAARAAQVPERIVKPDSYRTKVVRVAQDDPAPRTEGAEHAGRGTDAPLTRARRQRIALYAGGMNSNGITSSVVNVTTALSRAGFDVSVILARPFRADTVRNTERFAPGVRQFMRMGGMNATRLQHVRRRLIDSAMAKGKAVNSEREAKNQALFAAEWRRCVGLARFDTVIDYSGYSPFWARLILAGAKASGAGTRRLMWLHNDMLSDSERTVHGKATLRRGLRALFRLYGRFGALVSVSEALSAINERSLHEFGTGSARFEAVPNLLDVDALESGAATSLETVRSRAEAAELPDLVKAVDELSAGPSAFWFATVGRLSPEKNHERLIDAFVRTHAQHPHTRLLIVGGGPLREQLEAQVAHAVARGDIPAGAVVFSGLAPNPAALLTHVNCFALSSDYEGQPMVLLEAAALGLPIVTTRFGSVEGALPGLPIRIVDRSTEALAEGLTAAARGEVPPAHLDAHAYNREALTHLTELLLRD